MVNPIPQDITEEVTVCAGESFTWAANNESYTAADSPVMITLNDEQTGCPFTATLTINEFDVTEDVTITETVCVGESFTYEGEMYAAGQYTFNETDDNGCPFTITLIVNEFDPATPITEEVTVCAGESFTWDLNGETYTAADSPVTITLTTDDTGCEFTATLTINEINPEAGTITADATPICLVEGGVAITATANGDANVPDGYSLAYVLTSGDNLVIQNLGNAPSFDVMEAGLYTIHPFVFPSTFDPLSVVTPGVTTGAEVAGLLIENGGDALCASLDVAGAPIMVNPIPQDITEEVTVCAGESFTWAANNETYTAADSPVMITLNDEQTGCPFTATLTINEFDVTEDVTITETVCVGESFTYEGEMYAAGEYTFNETDDNGCPFTITLIVNEFDPATPITEEVTVCAGESFTWDLNGETYTAADSPVTITLTTDDTFLWSNGYLNYQ